jgi:hypothetical protein
MLRYVPALIVIGFSLSAPIHTFGQPRLSAGDADNFGDVKSADDKVVMRRPLATYLRQYNGNNKDKHGRQAMPFDLDTVAEAIAVNPPGSYANYNYDWEFGYTFPRLPLLGPNARLRLHLRANPSAPGNDALNLMYAGNGTNSIWQYGVGMNDLHAYKNGRQWGSGWLDGEIDTFDLLLADLPIFARSGFNVVRSGTIDLTPAINLAGYLDVHLADDTAVDWIELIYDPCLCDDGNLLHDRSFDSGSAPLQPYFRVPGDPWVPGDWNAEAASLVVGSSGGIEPMSPDGMIRVDQTVLVASQVSQIIDVSAFAREIDAGQATAKFSIWVNSPESGVQTGVTLRGGPAQTSVGTIDPVLGAIASSSLTTDSDSDSWEFVEGSLALAPNTRYLHFEFSGNNATIPASGVFFDCATLTLTPEPSTLLSLVVGAVGMGCVFFRGARVSRRSSRR